MFNGTDYLDLGLTVLNLGLSTYAIARVLSETGRTRRFWLGFLCLTLGMLLSSLAWLAKSLPAVTVVTKPYFTGPLALLALVLIVGNAPTRGSSDQH
jgi:hypothetical protein